MKKRLLNSPWLNVPGRILLGGIFLYASLDKLLHPLDFARIIVGYRLLPERIVGILAAVLPFVELICGLLLLLGIWSLASLTLIGGLLVVFMAGIVQAYLRGLPIDCGCFATSGRGENLGLETILRDLVILLLWLKVYAYYKQAPRVAPLS